MKNILSQIWPGGQPLSEKALQQTVESYAADPKLQQTFSDMVQVVRLALEDLTEGSARERQALAAAALLMFSRETMKENRTPDNIDAYGKRVRPLVEDYLLHVKQKGGRGLTATPELKHIGLAIAIATAATLPKGLAKVQAIVKDAKPEHAIEALQPQKKTFWALRQDAFGEIEQYMTGSHPKLEKAARDAFRETDRLLFEVFPGLETQEDAKRYGTETAQVMSGGTSKPTTTRKTASFRKRTP